MQKYNDILKILSQYEDNEFAVVENPKGIYPPQEIYPLAKAITTPSDVIAVLMDMDGTTTTTEELCIYSLETMVRRLGAGSDWNGFNVEKDYPNIIGNSTTKHIEYLLEKYGSLLNNESAEKHFSQAVEWTLVHGKDPDRVKEAQQVSKQVSHNGMSDSHYLKVGMVIYYQVYHSILERLQKGESKQIKEEVFGSADSTHNLIQPMQGIELFIPLIKGWLGKSVESIADAYISEYLEQTNTTQSKQDLLDKLVKISCYFEEKPAKTALVTSSIKYEAEIVIKTIYDELGSRVEASNLPKEIKSMLIKKYADFHNVYDSFITADNANEIRLKPHRDLYSTALYELGIPTNQFDKVVGLEDSTSGTIAIRAAGVGCSIALPFAQTHNHNFDAASEVLHGGIYELLFSSSVLAGKKKITTLVPGKVLMLK